MKFIATVAVAVSSLVAMASADMLQINNPTQGSIWTAGKTEFVGWTGNCNSMGAAGQNVTVDIVTGPANAVRYVATLGHLNCAGTNVRTDFTVPADIQSGTYALIVRTNPDPSYTNSFQINNAAAPAPQPQPSGPAPAPSSPAGGDNKPSAASSLAVSGAAAIAGAIAVAAQFL